MNNMKKTTMLDSKLYTIVEYAAKEKISISTLRRKIKKNEIKHKLIDGKYFICTDIDNESDKNDENVQTVINYENSKSNYINKELENYNALILENQRLKKEIAKYKEEITDIKMLISLYENEKKELRIKTHH
ncbi:MAG: hypothetical protein HQK51_02895 [Oligoflexia bacterium]|nr:hypothetical protein [Oligoflexia bacterium]